MSNPIYLFIYLTLEITYSVFGGWGLVVQDWCLGFWYLKIALKCRNDELILEKVFLKQGIEFSTACSQM